MLGIGGTAQNRRTTLNAELLRRYTRSDRSAQKTTNGAASLTKFQAPTAVSFVNPASVGKSKKDETTTHLAQTKLLVATQAMESKPLTFSTRNPYHDSEAARPGYQDGFLTMSRPPKSAGKMHATSLMPGKRTTRKDEDHSECEMGHYVGDACNKCDGLAQQNRTLQTQVTGKLPQFS